jgi:penicillin-binding protein 2
MLLSRLLWAPAAANDRLQRAFDDSMNRRNGAAVALDVETGRVLASYHMDVAARRLVPPGSAIKPFTLMALMEAGLVQEHTALFCPRKLRIGTHVLDCSHPVSPDPLDAVQALAYSCNHFFATLSGRLPLNALPQEFSGMGLGSLTGKWGTELPGVVEQPPSTQAMQLMAVGEEGIQVTPLGLAEAYRLLARPLRESPIPTSELQLVLKGLEAVVNSGTGQAASSRYVQVAGKTGTAGGHAWFAGFVPAEAPEIVIVVFLEHGTGGVDAAPIAGRVINSYYAGGKAP